MKTKQLQHLSLRAGFVITPKLANDWCKIIFKIHFWEKQYCFQQVRIPK